ncbi:uncharacterized protein LOC120125690 [Hibiscus syriacus]|uniref:uncharacterized protein LOC120125690 n=1 Tax=Hibiscus syriacus TaxID=106335 RepID=UPI0019227500|nr:uncharacterized protein LOC120125690 [Hibiscus syriacus]
MENTVGSDPWLFGGNFNVILNPKESSTPVNASLMTGIFEFQHCVEEMGLSDHSFIGPLFTWSNKHQDNFLARKLDRFLTNSGWFGSFVDSEVEFLAPGDSDHCPAFVWLHKLVPAVRPKQFKFFNFWALHPRFLQIVEESWQDPTEGNLAQALFLKLKGLKCCLKDFNKIYFNDISSRVKQKHEELSKIQLANLDFGTVGNCANMECEVERELKILEETKLLFYKQKAKSNWIKEGDQGSHFFHSMVASKRKSYTIRVLFDQNDRRLDSFEDMSSEVIVFFKNQLGMIDPNIKGCNVSTMRDLLGYFYLWVLLTPCVEQFLMRRLRRLYGVKGITNPQDQMDIILIFQENLGTIDSVMGVQSVLDTFYLLSRLKLNASKCEMFTASVPADLWALIREVIGFKLGVLPVRHLGVPLVTMKISIKDFQCLIDKIRAKLNSWANRHLSFAGSFARDMWGNVLSLCGINRCVSAWDKELASASQLFKGKTLIVQLLKLALAGHVYNIWRERNSRLFGGRARPVGDVLKDMIPFVFDLVNGLLAESTKGTFPCVLTGVFELAAVLTLLPC